MDEVESLLPLNSDTLVLHLEDKLKDPEISQAVVIIIDFSLTSNSYLKFIPFKDHAFT